MQAQSAPHGLNDGDYEEIEAAVMETARGRWFLAEFEKRHRATQFDALMQAIQRLEHSVALIQQPVLPVLPAPAADAHWQAGAPSDTLLARLARVAAPLAKYHLADQPSSVFLDNAALPETSPYPEMGADETRQAGREEDASLLENISHGETGLAETDLLADAAPTPEDAAKTMPLLEAASPTIMAEETHSQQSHLQELTSLSRPEQISSCEEKPASLMQIEQNPWQQPVSATTSEVGVNSGTDHNQDYQKKMAALSPLDKLSASDKMRLFI